MRKKFWDVILFVFTLMIFAAQGFAEQALTVAVIDSQKTFQNSIEGRKAISLLQEREQQINFNLAQIDKKIQDLDTKLNTQKLVMTFEAQEQLAFDLDKLRTERKRVSEDSLKDWQRLQFQLFNKIREEVNPIIEDVAKEKGYSLVLDLSSNSVAYFSLAIDITDEVVKRYDAAKSINKDKSFNLAKIQ
jgi:outer membrane protein